MDYPFEDLDPERFQQFCQALLVREFSGLQCFPVAQPDGGRDAIRYLIDGDSEAGFLVYQVKFRRERTAQSDSREWLMGVIESEAPKIAKLIPKGARQFILVTNVSGTAHADVGSMDRVGDVLATNIGVPSICLWREDLSRRLDNAWDLKWMYPELMTGPDLIRVLVESRLTEDRERRTATLLAFLRDQFERDSQVKFKQVELQNSLLDLFVDVPAVLANRSSSKRLAQISRAISQVAADSARLDESAMDRWPVASEHQVSVGGATLLLHPSIHPHLSRLVLEGAPGQGKSTITQYICQVHRMLILKDPSIAQISTLHRMTPARLPFRVDLRDFATWLTKKDPFSASESNVPADIWSRSLESFLAAQVRHFSGGGEFSVDDLRAVAITSPLLLVFDGLDEVAEISRRRDVVDEITHGINRLAATALSIQAVVTSRPSVFANSPGFPADKFPVVQLDSVTRPLIDAYAQKWLRARRVYGREAGEVQRILREKLDQPHLRDLARNPMQLAILLSLIHTRGSSLPDKRTALYDSYTELFFSREAEKSQVVRDNRDILVDIHGFLAWTLHRQAESGDESGKIAADRLEQLVTSYLSQEEQDVSIASALFKGVVERAGALVSRVQGTFEFEVQPLREYFAARYLYETAQYSPAGDEKSGTLPDRFDAMARNFYWLNVTRFYAGCFSKGELPSLVDRVQELVRDSTFSRLSYPRYLAATLLSDWVFSQHARSMREIVSLVTDRSGLRALLLASGRKGPQSMFSLPIQAGRAELVQRCVELLRSGRPHDYVMDVIELLRANMTSEGYELWESEARRATGPARTDWLRYGLYLGMLGKCPPDLLREFLEESPGDFERLQVAIQARRSEVLQSASLVQQTINAVLERDIQLLRGGKSATGVEALARTLNPSLYAVSFRMPAPIPLFEAQKQWHAHFEDESSSPAVHPLFLQCDAITRIAEEQSRRPCGEWATTIEPWSKIVEAARAAFGEGWSLYHFANHASAIRSAEERCSDASSLSDSSHELCRRARYARLRAGNPQWWERQMAECKTSVERAFALLLLLTWGSDQTIAVHGGLIDQVLSELDATSWRRLRLSLSHGVMRDERHSLSAVELEAQLPKDMSLRTAIALSERGSLGFKRSLCARFVDDQEQMEPAGLEFIHEVAFETFSVSNNADDIRWSVETLRSTYVRGASLGRHRYAKARPLPADIAMSITASPEQYPMFLLGLADETYRSRVAETVVPVGDIAVRDRWFESTDPSPS